VKLFSQAELKTFNLMKVNLDEKLSLAYLEKEIVEEFTDLNKKETKKNRLNYFKVKGALENDYSEKLLDLGNNKKVIFGIRNFGGDRERPFIKLRSTFLIESKEEALLIYEKIKSELSIFKPLYLSFMSPFKIDSDFIGQITMVLKSKNIKERASWDTESQLSFIEVKDTEYYNWYKKGYEEFHLDRPDLKKTVMINNKSIMDLSLREGLLHFVEINNERIGLIAGEKAPFLGHDGFYFNEIFISKNWKGKGLAKAIQRKFIEKFTSGNELVWGTIDSHNLPSYKTALSNGRLPVRYECFIQL